MVIGGETIEQETQILLHQLPQVGGDKTVHRVTNLVLQVVEAQVVGETLVSIEMIDESVNLVPAEHRRAKTEIAQIAERHRYALAIPEDGRGDLRIEAPFESETELLNERRRPRQLRNAERSLCQKDRFLSVLLLNSWMKNRWLSSNI